MYFFWDFPSGSDLSQGLGLLQWGESCIAPVIMGIISYFTPPSSQKQARSSQAVCVYLFAAPGVTTYCAFPSSVFCHLA